MRASQALFVFFATSLTQRRHSPSTSFVGSTGLEKFSSLEILFYSQYVVKDIEPITIGIGSHEIVTQQRHSHKQLKCSFSAQVAANR